MRGATGHRNWQAASVGLLFFLALTWGLLQFGAAETATLYRLFLFLLAPAALSIVRPAAVRLDWRLFGIGLFGVLLLGLVAVQPTLEGRGPLVLTVGWISFWIALYLVDAESRLRWFLIAGLVLLGLLEAFFGLLQSVGGVDYIGRYFRNSGRVATGSLINRNHFAALLNMLIPLAMGLLVSARGPLRGGSTDRSEALARTWILLLGSSVMGVSVLLSQSRAGTLSLLATLTYVGILMRAGRRRAVSARRSGLIALVMLSLILGLGGALGLEALVLRFGRLEEGVSRLEVYRDTLGMIGESPLSGVGPGMYRWAFRTYQKTQQELFYDHAHNDYLETAAEWGVPLALLAWGFVLWRFWRSSLLAVTAAERESRGLALGTAGSLLSILVHSLVDFSLQIPVVLMVFASVVALSWSLDLGNRMSLRTGRLTSLSLRVLLIAALIAAGWVVVQRSRAVQVARPENGVAGLETAVRLDPQAPEHRFLLGMAYRDLPGAGDPKAALEQLRTAVRLNPFSWRYWLELSKMQELQGDPTSAEESMRVAVRLNPASGAYRWRLANLLLRHAPIDDAVGEIAAAVSLDPHLAAAAIAILLKAEVDPLMIKSLLPADRSVLLRTLQQRIARGEGAAATNLDQAEAEADLLDEIWRRLLAEHAPVLVGEGSAYVSHLIRSGRTEEARQTWIEMHRSAGRRDPAFEEGGSRVWNGAFELPLSGRPLGWHFSDDDAFTARRSEGAGTSGSTALEIEFHGIDNIEFLHVSQDLLLHAGARYRLSFEMRAQDLSTDQGVMIEVLAREPDVVLAVSSPVLGTTPWRREGLTFELPEESVRSTLRLRRRASQQIDRAIRGKVWLDSVTIVQVQP